MIGNPQEHVLSVPLFWSLKHRLDFHALLLETKYKAKYKFRRKAKRTIYAVPEPLTYQACLT